MSLPKLMTFNSNSASSSYASNDFTIPLRVPIYLNEQYEISLKELSTFYSWPNISAQYANNSIIVNDGTTDFTITLADGTYTLEDINEAVFADLVSQGAILSTDPAPVTIEGDYNILRVVVSIVTAGYSVDLTAGATSDMKTVLGFSDGSNITATETGDLSPDLSYGITQINLNCSLLDGSNDTISDGKSSSILASFVPNVAPGYALVVQPAYPVYVKMNQSQSIESVRLWLSDNVGRTVDLRGEDMSVVILSRKADPIEKALRDLSMKVDNLISSSNGIPQRRF